MAGRGDLRDAILAAHFRNSGPGITATFRTGLIPPVGRFNSCSPWPPRVRRKKAFCGGPQNTGITICTRTQKMTCIRLGAKVFYIAMSGGYSPVDTTKPT